MEMSSAERVHLFAQVLPYEHDTQYYRLAYLGAWIYSWPASSFLYSAFTCSEVGIFRCLDPSDFGPSFFLVQTLGFFWAYKPCFW